MCEWLLLHTFTSKWIVKFRNGVPMCFFSHNRKWTLFLVYFGTVLPSLTFPDALVLFSMQRMHWNASIFGYQKLFSGCLECWNMAGLKLSPPVSFPLSSPLPPSLILLFFFPLKELLFSRLHILFDNDKCPKKSLMSVCIDRGNSAWIQGIPDESFQFQSSLKCYLKSTIF